MANKSQKLRIFFLFALIGFCLLEKSESLLILKFIDGYVFGRLLGKYHYEKTHPNAPY